MMNELQNKESLQKILEDLRIAKYSDIPADLVSKIIEIQSADRENLPKTVKAIREEILKYIPQE